MGNKNDDLVAISPSLAKSEHVCDDSFTMVDQFSKIVEQTKWLPLWFRLRWVGDIEGGSYSVDGNAGQLGGSVAFGDSGWNGLAVSYGPGAGVSASAGSTGTLSLRSIGNWFSGLWNSVTGYF